MFDAPPPSRPSFQVIASKEESKNHWQQKDYKGFNSSTDWDTADFSKASLVGRDGALHIQVLEACHHATTFPDIIYGGRDCCCLESCGFAAFFTSY